MNFLYALEKIRTPFLDKFMSVATNLGGEYIFLVLAIIVFWCVSKRCGYYVMTVGFMGILANQFLKIFCRIPRPWVKDPNFTIVESARADAGGYSFPSGHTQSVFAAIGAPARYLKKRAISVIAVLLIVLTAFSRMYLGVHTPLDVGVSFVIGTVLVFALYPVFRDMEEKPKAVYIIYAVFIVLSAAFVAYLELYPFPANIDADNYASALKNGYMLLFCAVGLLLVLWLDSRYIKFTTDAVWWVQIIKVVIGLGLVFAIKFGLKAPLIAIFNGHPAAHGLRYFLMVMAAGSLWPLTFNRFSKLGNKKTER